MDQRRLLWWKKDDDEESEVSVCVSVFMSD